MSVNIDRAFISTLIDGGLEIDLVFENGVWSYWDGSDYQTRTGTYTPTNGRPYAEITTFPAGADAMTLADSNEDIGVYQVSLRYPADSGDMAAKIKADEVFALMKIWQTISYGTQNVHIISHSRLGGRVDGGFYILVLRLNYRAFVTR